MISGLKINTRIEKKILNSSLKSPIKDFMLEILNIEMEGGQYSENYSRELDKACVKLLRDKK